MSNFHNDTTYLSSVERLKHWTDTTRIKIPMREGATIPFLHKFSLDALREGLVHVLAVHRTLENEHDALDAIRKSQYAHPKNQRAFRFIDHLAALGTPGLVADGDLWMDEQCMKAGATAAFCIRGFSAGAGTDGMWKTAQMLMHSIEVLTRLNWFVRERIEAFRWAIGVAQGDVDDEKMMEWWARRFAA